MRLIDAYALIDNMEGHVTTMSVCSTTIEARAKSEMKRTCISDVANATTIDAIPMWWITEKFLDVMNKDKELSKAVWLVRKAWTEEQEAR